MPFEPLRTDEKLDAKTAPEKSMDDQMLAGCTGFLIASLTSYSLAVWPFFLFATSTNWSDVLLAMAMGLIPCAIFGAFATRRFGLPGACGFVGAALAIAIFLHLNVNRIILGLLAQRSTGIEIPPLMAYIIPVGWLLLALVIALVLMPRGELPGSDDPTKP